MYAKLDSVGSLMDFVSCIVYPLQTDGLPDLNCPTHASDCCEEWWEKLSSSDRETVEGLLNLE